MTVLSYTGNYQTYTVPAGVYYLDIDLIGAEGGFKNAEFAAKGGAGARIRSAVPVTPGEVLRFYVGGCPSAPGMAASQYNVGGFNGGGSSLFLSGSGGSGNGGGGATDVRRAPYAVANRLLVAGGGGGTGYIEGSATQYLGGAGSNHTGNGGNGLGVSTSVSGKGATRVAGGAGGVSTGDASRVNGAAGAAGVGGRGGYSAYSGTGGGGGGGHWGGGGGAVAAASFTQSHPGGGGTSATVSGTTISSSAGVNFTGASGYTGGHGKADFVEYVTPVPTFTVAPAVGYEVEVNYDTVHVHPDSSARRQVELQFSQSADFSSGVITNTGVVGITLKNAVFRRTMPSQGTWYVRMRGYGEKNLPYSEWSAAQSFVSTHIPSASIVSPANGIAVDYAATIPFSISATDIGSVNNDKVFAYQILAYDNATDELLWDSTKKLKTASFGENFTVDGAMPANSVERMVRWRVRVWDETDTPSEYSDPAIFMLTTKPVVAVTYPFNNGTVDSGAPTFTWEVQPLSFSRTIVKFSATVTDTRNNSVAWSDTRNSSQTSVTPPSTVLVNNVEYVIKIVVTDSKGLVGEASARFKTSYISPDPIKYEIITNRQDDLGAIVIDWSNTVADPSLVAWRVYRRDLPDMKWNLLAEINDEGTRTYQDFMVRTGDSHMYAVTQVADRSGVLLESPVGYRAKNEIEPDKINNATNPSFETAGPTYTVRRNETKNPFAAVTASGTATEIRRNLVNDPKGSLTARWRASAGDTLSVVTDGGEPAIEISEGAVDSSTSVYIDPNQSFNVNVGDVVTFEIEIKVLVPFTKMSARVGGYNGAIFTQTSPVNERAQVPTDGWVRYRVTGTISGVAGGYIRTLAWPTNSVPAGPAFRIRRAIVEIGTSGPYFDGSTNPFPGLFAAWSGAANASPSTLTATARAFTGFGTYGYGVDEVGYTVAVVGATDGPLPGISTYMRRYTTKKKTSGSSGMQCTAGQDRASWPGVAGDVRPVGFWVRYISQDGAKLQGKFRISLYNSGGSVVTSSDTATFDLPSGQWVWVSHQVTATADFATVGWWLFQTDSQTPDVWSSYDATAAITGEGQFFAGGFSTDADFFATWDGTANASTSTLSALSVPGVAGGLQSGQWSRLGSKSLRVEAGKSATIVVTGPKNVITARNANQVAQLGSTFYTSASENQAMVIQGSGNLILSQGWWDMLGDGIEVYFDGSTPPPDSEHTNAWLGAPNASKSVQSEIPTLAEDRISLIRMMRYWLISLEHPELTIRLDGVVGDPSELEFESETFNIIGRGRHTDYGDRLGYTGSLEVHVREPEYRSTIRERVEELREAQETYQLRTPFGRLFSVSLGNIGWTPLAGSGEFEMGDLTIPYMEVN